MATVKTPEERGHPAAAWAYHAREKLGLSDREVVERLGRYDEATLRKAESHSRNLSRPLWRALVPLYQGLAAERGLVLPVPPDFHAEPRGGSGQDGDLAAAIREQTRAINALVDELRVARATPQPDLAEVVARSVAAALQAAGVRAG